jgi:2-C-methyl-D-erythritol 4-phosphate cytidylyltransferase
MVLTGGSGERIKGLDYPKQFYEIGGKPVFIYSLETYEQMDKINDIYLIINPEYTQRYKAVLQKYKFSKLQRLVEGGKTRQGSVENGLNAMRKTDIVVLQDGANPTTHPDLIGKCIDAAHQFGASTGCVAASDTVVQKKDNAIDVVLDRESLAYTCSPQVYRYDVIRDAFLHAKKNNLLNQPTVTLIKKINQNVVLVPCLQKTVKITHYEDFYLAEQVLKFH